MLKDIKNRIIDEYEEIRTRALALKDKRTAEVYEKYPELLKISKDINMLGFENTKKIMKNPLKAKELNAEFKKELLNLLDLKAEFIKKNNIDPDFDKVIYNCKECKDTGFLDNGKKCACFKEKIINYTYKSSNLSEIMKDMCFNNFSLDYYTDEDAGGVSEKENMELILKASKNFCENLSKKRNILFHGSPGLGKTFMSVSIARELIEKGKTVIYVSATKLFTAYNDYKFLRDEKLEDFFNDIYNADLLIIDDLGTEYISKVSVSFLFDLVNDRILNNKKIIINTNLTPDELKNAYSVRFMSRIYEYFDVFKFSGSDIRIQKQYK